MIRELRHLRALTQEQFAPLLGVTYTTVNRWENGRALPSPLALRQIRSVLEEMGVSPNEEWREGAGQLLERYFFNGVERP